MKRTFPRVPLTISCWLGPSLLFWWWFGRVLPFYPILNLDLLLAGVLACLLPRLAVPVWALASTVAASSAAAAIFHFQSPIDLMRYGDAPTLDFTALAVEHAGFVALAVASVVVGWIGARVAVRRHALWMIVVVVALGIADQRHLSERLPPSQYGPINVAGSPSLALVRHHLLAPPRRVDKLSDTVRLADRVVDWAAQHPKRNIVFVVVESMGAPRDPTLAGWLEGFIAPAPGYRVERGTTPFKGSTTSGELRHLCQLAGSYEQLGREAGEACLPARLARSGYSTQGFHAFSGRMFQRSRWWPQIGLQRNFFLEELTSKVSPKRCGQAFRGACDEEIVDLLGLVPTAANGQFSYLLTLNTHLPVEPSENEAAPREVCDAHAVAGRACTLMGMQARLFKRLHERVLLRADRPLLVIVGDHAAPLSDPRERGVFVADRVPYWVFTPE